MRSELHLVVALGLLGCAPASGTLSLAPNSVPVAAVETTVFEIAGLRPEELLEARDGRVQVASDLRVTIGAVVARPTSADGAGLRVMLDAPLTPGSYDLVVVARGRTHVRALALTVTAQSQDVGVDDGGPRDGGPDGGGAGDADTLMSDGGARDTGTLADDAGADANTGCTGAPRCNAAGDSLESCTAGRLSAEVCRLGCASTPSAHCRVLVPSNVSPDLLIPGVDVILGMSASWDTSACLSLPGSPIVAAQTGGGDVCVVRFGSFTVDTGATLTVVGSRPLVVLAWNDIAIDGRIDVSARGPIPGAGGGRGGTASASATGVLAGPSGGHVAPIDDAGGTGGSLSGLGGTGGRGGRAVAGACPGLPIPDLTPLVSGSGGGRGGTGASAGFGGAGSGAIQLTARGRLSVWGSILAGGGGGGGGLGGTPTDANMGAGGGGGSGGGILLEGLDVEIGAILRATGGGGGSVGCPSGPGSGLAGANGGDGADRMSGGAAGLADRRCTAGWDIDGGGGAGALSVDGAPGGGPGLTNGGGGGGSAGLIEICGDALDVSPSAMLSPSAAPGVLMRPCDAR